MLFTLQCYIRLPIWTHSNQVKCRGKLCFQFSSYILILISVLIPQCFDAVAISVLVSVEKYHLPYPLPLNAYTKIRHCGGTAIEQWRLTYSALVFIIGFIRLVLDFVGLALLWFKGVGFMVCSWYSLVLFWYLIGLWCFAFVSVFLLSNIIFHVQKNIFKLWERKNAMSKGRAKWYWEHRKVLLTHYYHSPPQAFLLVTLSL